ncbi:MULTISPECIES: hypothetical protein [Pseudanabaena]|uniref:hypothetical protein n=1 Tax=Pseudanabaena TaxID=1152 RepID=UPI002479D794|nr:MULTISPECIES: hypothetical protein [Pseudanabaena]MEA5486527.1 hypothetical protein [Pseudanabaena sp. CCNP1317]WGS74212.1 hypothetical protein OA858_09345 [Pseudanabaena galeata CCNP1313]
MKISWILPNSLAIAAKYILQHSLKNISKACGDRCAIATGFIKKPKTSGGANLRHLSLAF